MSSFRRIAALVLLAILPPATWHCDLEAAGVIPEAAMCTTEASHDHASNHGCEGDSCRLIETATYRPTVPPKFFIPALQPVDLLAAHWLVAPEPLEDATAIRQGYERPLDWIPQWRFVQRAAPQARAPSDC